jgi:hypothetical protein
LYNTRPLVRRFFDQPAREHGALFQKAEDPLLATGIVLFGDDKEAISRLLLPTKTHKQVAGAHLNI